jgi:hypothetical protein
MNCPHCQKELPGNYGAAWCPLCGKDLSPAPVSLNANVPPRKFNWPFFTVILCAPAVADFVLVTFISNPMDIFGTMMLISFGGSVISGVGCGIILARWKDAAGLQFISQAMAYSFLMAFASFGLCCVGCTVTGIVQSAAQSSK